MKELKDINIEILRQLNIDNEQLSSYSFSNVSELGSMAGFDNIVQEEIERYIYINKFNYEKLSQILTALAIDSEGAQVEEVIENKFKGQNLIDLILIGLAHPWKEVRWQVLEILGKSTIDNKASLLFYALSKEKNTYVLRVGLKILSKVKLALAKEIAEKHLESEDSYLRILSTDIAQLP